MAEEFKVQSSIFGDDNIQNMNKNVTENQKHILNYLSAMCCGDYYTRNDLDIAQHEIITMCVILTLGVCDPQLKAHIRANLNVGNYKKTLLTASTQCMPYIGFPRIINELSLLNTLSPVD